MVKNFDFSEQNVGIICRSKEDYNAMRNIMIERNFTLSDGKTYETTPKDRENCVFYYNDGTIEKLSLVNIDDIFYKLYEFSEIEFTNEDTIIKSIVKNINEDVIIKHRENIKRYEYNMQENKRTINSCIESIRFYIDELSDIKKEPECNLDSIKEINDFFDKASISDEDIIEFCNKRDSRQDYINKRALLYTEEAMDRIISIKSSSNEIANFENFINDLKEKIEKEKIKEDKTTIETFNKDLETIKSNKFVDSVELYNDEMIVKTKSIKCNFIKYGDSERVNGKFVRNEKKYYAILGRYAIHIPYSMNREITLFNLDDSRQGYWSEEDNHPHVDNCGHACFGSTSALITQGYEDNSYYEVFLAVLAFLQQADTEDSAGRNVTNWVCYDLNGNEVQLETGTHCSCCGDEIYDDEYYMCEDCGATLCSECAVYVDGSDKYVCNECLNKNYFYCEECNNYYLNDSIVTVYGDIGSSSICLECFDELVNRGDVVECGDCGNDYYTEDTIYDEETGMYYCSKCYKDLIKSREDKESE